MRFGFVAAVFATLAVAGEATPQLRSSRRSGITRRYLQHEARPVAAARPWKKTARLHHEVVLPVRIGLTQQNLHRAEELLNDVSHPDSPNYGRHWTPEQVADTFAPTQEAIDAVTAWLAEDGGIGMDRVRLSRGRNWVQFNATVREVENLLRTEYNLYRHADHGAHHIACDQYHVPAHLQEHIDLIMPTVHFDSHLGTTRTTKTATLPDHAQKELRRRAIAARWKDAITSHAGARFRAKKRAPLPQPQPQGQGLGPDKTAILGGPNDASLPKQGALVENAMMDLSQCDTMITPACLRALYSIPAGTLAGRNNTLGIVEYTPQAILQSDLNLYFSQFQPKLQGQGPLVKLVDNAVLQTTNQSFDFNGESALDLEFAMALIYPQTATLFQVGDLTQGASFNNLLDALDGSYCTSGGGDDPTQDGIYNSSIACGTATPTKVISTSYSYNEADLTPAYERRQCAEYMKLGLQGVSVLYSSGDFGVAGNGDTCIDAQTGAYNDGTSGVFNPSFPGTCPYITSVGATQLPNGTSVRGAEAACETVIFSGGGFSNVFSMPSYQQSHVAAYFANSTPPYSAARFNNSRTVRGYPDVSANGANYVVAVDGNFSLAYGTSASAPTFASVLNLINEQRIKANKSSVGFVNPVLYANPQVLKDITAGNNPGCGTRGFTAVAGWDPLTGLGTPNYAAMEKLFLSLQ